MIEKEWIEIMRRTVADTLSTGRRVVVQRTLWNLSSSQVKNLNQSLAEIDKQMRRGFVKSDDLIDSQITTKNMFEKAIIKEEEDRNLLNELCDHLRANGHTLQIYLNQEGNELKRIFFENISTHIIKIDNDSFDYATMTYKQSYEKSLKSFKEMINAKTDIIV